MKLFGRTAGYYLFWAGFVYFWVSVYLAFTQTGHSEYASLGLVLALSVPLLCPPVARHFNMEPVMFDWIKNLGKPTKETYPTWADIPAWDADMKNIGNDMSKVIPFPDPKAAPIFPDQVPYHDEPSKQEPAKIFYRIGATDQNRVAFSMGQMEITMNREGCQQMIDQLTVFMNQIKDEE